MCKELLRARAAISKERSSRLSSGQGRGYDRHFGSQLREGRQHGSQIASGDLLVVHRHARSGVGRKQRKDGEQKDNESRHCLMLLVDVVDLLIHLVRGLDYFGIGLVRALRLNQVNEFVHDAYIGLLGIALQ